jgi:hypothetical protein
MSRTSGATGKVSWFASPKATADPSSRLLTTSLAAMMPDSRVRTRATDMRYRPA